MNSIKWTARIVGALFIAATVASSLSIAISSPILEPPDFLSSISANEHQVIMAALLMLIDVIGVVGIAVMMYPILKRRSETSAIGYVAARIIEGVFHSGYVVIVLVLLALSQEFVGAGAPDASYFQTAGTLLRAASDRVFSLGLGLPFAISALILNYSLYQSRLIPRWLSGWGFVGAALVLALYVLEYFDIHQTEILHLAIALQEMIFAVWLIVKGFNASAARAKSA
jgi:hypothetical protein